MTSGWRVVMLRRRIERSVSDRQPLWRPVTDRVYWTTLTVLIPFLNALWKPAARAKMSLSRTKNIFTPANMNFFVILDIVKLFYKAQNDILPESLSRTIFKNRCNGYSLRGQDCLMIPRFQTRYRKDSLRLRRGDLLALFPSLILSYYYCGE